MACFVGILNISCVIAQLAFCIYLYIASVYENLGNIHQESRPDVKNMVKEKMGVICKDLNLFTTYVCIMTINVMTMKEIYQKAQLVSIDSLSTKCKILV